MPRAAALQGLAQARGSPGPWFCNPSWPPTPISLAITGFLGCDLDDVFFLLNNHSGKRDSNFERLALIVPLLSTNSALSPLCPPPPTAPSKCLPQTAVGVYPERGSRAGRGSDRSALGCGLRLWGHIAQPVRTHPACIQAHEGCFLSTPYALGTPSSRSVLSPAPPGRPAWRRRLANVRTGLQSGVCVSPDLPSCR